uniref:Uncharacterized protein n=1 Tax=Chenopodium quinoa TaxID=63459 RepID=A0A803MSD1_CHEQI
MSAFHIQFQSKATIAEEVVAVSQSLSIISKLYALLTENLPALVQCQVHESGLSKRGMGILLQISCTSNGEKMELRLHDGFWGVLDHRDSSLVKDSLSSTLACVLALKRWSVGEEQTTKGLDFIVSHFSSAMDEEQHSPIGFDVIFPSMIEKALNMEVNESSFGAFRY